MTVTKDLIYQRLSTVMDPELNIDLVSLGLIYDVTVKELQAEGGAKPFVHILMTLTTPGCPLAHVFDQLVKESLMNIQGLDHLRDVELELTFDPPWLPEMMTEEARAELGL